MEPLRILLVDDDPNDRMLVVRELHREFPEVEITQVSEAEGLARSLEMDVFDLVITDYQLVWADGLDVLRAVKERWPDAPALMFTASGSEEVAVEAMKHGAADYLVKSPRRFLVLPVVVRRALESARQREARRQAEQALRHRERQQAAVARLGQRALEGANLGGLMKEAASLVAENLEVEFVRILERLPGGQAFTLSAGAGWGDGGPMTVEAGADSQAGYTLATGSPVVVKDLQGETRFQPSALLRARGVVNGLSVVIPAGYHPFGVLEAHSATRRAFTEDDVHFLKTVANVIAAAVQQRRSDAVRDALAAILEATPDFVGMADPGGKVTYLNRAGRRLVGMSPSVDVTETMMHDYAAPWAVRLVLEQGIPAAGRDGFWVGETALQHQDGGEIPVSQVILAHRAAGGALAYLSTIARDLSASKRDEEELRHQKEILQTVFDHIPVMVVFLDANGRPLLVNREWERVMGWALDDAARVDIFAEAYPDPVYRQEVLEAVRAGTSRWADFRTRVRDGRTLETSWAYVRLSDGTRIGIGQDISERTRLEAQFRQAQKMEAVGRLAGGIAHDFNNLLNVITGYGELVVRQLTAEHAERKRVEQILKAAERAASLTRQLLAFSRLQVHKPRVLSLNEVVEAMQKMLRPLIGEDIDLAFHAGARGNVRADPGQIEQILMNLVVNSRDAMPGGGRVTIETADAELGQEYVRRHLPVRPGPYVMLAVTDTGHGMDAETQARVFEPFFTTKAPGEGTGLGLSTVYGIVKQSEGYVWVYSEPGHGSSFKIYLPRVGEPLEPETPSPRVVTDTSGKETILVVEDEEMAREMLSEALTLEGYRVLSARDGDDALVVAAQAEETLDLLLTDVVMPKMGGRDLAERLGAQRRALRVLYMSGYPSEAISHRGMLQEGVPFLQKPFTPDELLRRVREVLDSPPFSAG